MAPPVQGFDHLHVFVQDRALAEIWYANVLGLLRVPEFEFWSVDGGPLVLRDVDNSYSIALFERPRQPNRSTLALRVDACTFTRWRAHLAEFGDLNVKTQDHERALSLYFSDPDGNPYEITTYEHAAARNV